MKNLENLILSLIIARLDGDKISDQVYSKYIKKLVDDGIGGFVLFGGEYEEVKEFLFHLQSKSLKPLIIASDMERGVGQQINKGTIIPCQMAIAAGFDSMKDLLELENLYSLVINEAFDLGINLALLPVLDVNSERLNPIICTRAFSDDPQLVSYYGTFLIKTFKKYGLATCGKHFPGHGGTKIDSHLHLPIIEDYDSSHLKPFKAVIDEGIPAIMVGHLLLPHFDCKPATLSGKIMKELLRKNLNFNGLILTDAMNMRALKDYPHCNASAIKEGAHVILHPEDPYEAKEEILRNLKKGFIGEKTIWTAHKMVTAFTRNLRRRGKLFKLSKDKDYLVNDAFKRSLTVLKNELTGITKVTPYLVGFYNENLKDLFVENFGKVSDLKSFSANDSIPLIAIFTDIKGGKRQYDIEEEDKVFIEKIVAKYPTILVNFGNPYVLTPFLIEKAKTVVLLYDSNEQALIAFLESFKEGLKNSGKLPVKLVK